MDDDNVRRDGMVGGNIDLLHVIRNLRNSHDNVELRIQLLEEITSRLREQRGLAQSNLTVLETSDASAVQNTGSEENETDRGYKRKHSELVAKASEDVSDVKKDDSDGGSFYDCNICLDMAKDPVLTCCGHLFCWGCFYRLKYVELTTKECPVCRGDVMDSQLTPIYGSVSGSHVADPEPSVCIPPRPKAHRMENARQRARQMEIARRRVNRSVTDVPVVEVLRRIRMAVGGITERPRQQEQNNPLEEQPGQRVHNSNVDSIAELLQPSWTEPSWADAGIGGSQHNESTTEPPRQQNASRETSEIGDRERERDNVRAEQPNLDVSPATSLTGVEPPSLIGEIGARQHLHSRHLSRSLLETATSLSSISFALDNTERLVDTLSNRVAVIQSELQSLNSIAEVNVAPADASSVVVAPSENPETASSVSDHSHSSTRTPSWD